MTDGMVETPSQVARVAPGDVSAAFLTALDTGAAVCRAETGVVELAGPGAVTCVQGLLTNDVELPGDDYPLLLTTDRSLYHYHTGTMTRRVPGLEKLNGWELLHIHPGDAARLDVADGQWVHVMSRRGELDVRAKVTEDCSPGVVSLTFHFSEAPTNVLTHAALDPVSKIPETKVCAVRVEKCP